MAAALPAMTIQYICFKTYIINLQASSFRSGRETFIVKNYRSMLNFFYSEGVRLTA